MQLRGKNLNYNDSNCDIEVVQTECWCQTEELKVELVTSRDTLNGNISIIMRNIQWPIKQRWRQFIENKWERSVILSKEEFMDFVDKLNEVKDYIIENNVELLKTEGNK